MLWVRDLDATELRALPGTDGAGFPFWSPDSKSIAFFGGGYLKRVELGGGSPQALCGVAFGRGGSWSQKNEILFAPTGNSGLLRVNASGGTPQPVTKLDASRGEVSNRWPLFLPDGNHFLYLIRRPATAGAGEKIYVASLDTPNPRVLLTVSSNVIYVDPGDLLYMRDRTLMMQRFNTRTLELEGYPVRETSSAESAIEILNAESFPIVISDIYMAGKTGLDVLHRAKSLNPSGAVILMSGKGSIERSLVG